MYTIVKKREKRKVKHTHACTHRLSLPKNAVTHDHHTKHEPYILTRNTSTPLLSPSTMRHPITEVLITRDTGKVDEGEELKNNTPQANASLPERLAPSSWHPLLSVSLAFARP